MKGSPHSESQTKQINARCACYRLNIWKSHFINIFPTTTSPYGMSSGPSCCWPQAYVPHVQPGSGLLAAPGHSWDFSSTCGGHIRLRGTQADGTSLEVGLGAGGECRVAFSVFSPDIPPIACLLSLRQEEESGTLGPCLSGAPIQQEKTRRQLLRGPLHSESLSRICRWDTLFLPGPP